MIRLSLSAAHNPNADSKIERGDGPIVKLFVKACKGHTRDRLKVLSYAGQTGLPQLNARYMSIKLIQAKS